MMITLLLLACAGDPASEDLTVTDRAPGDRTPLTAACSDIDPIRCHLPWPNDTFTVADASSPTGLHVQVDTTALPIEDDAGFINIADGFSRLSPVATAWATRLDDSWLDTPGQLLIDPPIHLINAQPDSPDYGQEFPLWAEIVQTGIEQDPLDMIVAYPLGLLEAGADYDVVVTDDLHDIDGAPIEADRAALLITGQADPETTDEAALVGYHAPTRAALDAAGIDPAHVVRAWDFTTRSTDDATRRLQSMLDQAEDADIGVRIDTVVLQDDPVAAIVRGYITDIPSFVDEDNRLVLDDDGLPTVIGTHEAPFRLALPTATFPGEDGYHIAVYGHGTGGSETDNAFDEDITSWGVAKAAFRIGAWNGDDLLTTLAGFNSFLLGTEQATAVMAESIVDGHALLQAFGGPLDQALSAETLGDEVNPLAGVHPITDDPMWLGGSLGGTTGAIVGAAWPELGAAVLNVPAGAWVHLIPDSLMYESTLKGMLLAQYDSEIDVRLGIVMSATSWDDVDGVAWSERSLAAGTPFLLQESMGDPIVPNQGTGVLAIALGAQHVGPMLEPIMGVSEVDQVVNGVGITQYRVPDTGVYDVHGFAARSTLAGDAAMEQIAGFLQSTWAGESVITFPEGCSQVTANGDCDFSGMWED